MLWLLWRFHLLVENVLTEKEHNFFIINQLLNDPLLVNWLELTWQHLSPRLSHPRRLLIAIENIPFLFFLRSRSSKRLLRWSELILMLLFTALVNLLFDFIEAVNKNHFQLICLTWSGNGVGPELTILLLVLSKLRLQLVNHNLHSLASLFQIYHLLLQLHNLGIALFICASIFLLLNS